MTDKLPLLDATYLKVQKFADETCHANAWVHQVKNKLHILVLSYLLPNNGAQSKSTMEGWENRDRTLEDKAHVPIRPCSSWVCYQSRWVSGTATADTQHEKHSKPQAWGWLAWSDQVDYGFNVANPLFLKRYHRIWRRAHLHELWAHGQRWRQFGITPVGRTTHLQNAWTAWGPGLLDALGPPEKRAQTTACLGSRAPSRWQVLDLSPGCCRWLAFSDAAVMCLVYSDLSASEPQLFPEGYKTQQTADKQYKTWFHAVMLLFLWIVALWQLPDLQVSFDTQLFSSGYFFFLIYPQSISNLYCLYPSPAPLPGPWLSRSPSYKKHSCKFTSKLTYLVPKSLTLSACGFCCQCWLCLIIFSVQISSVCSLQSEADILPGWETVLSLFPYLIPYIQAACLRQTSRHSVQKRLAIHQDLLQI